MSDPQAIARMLQSVTEDSGPCDLFRASAALADSAAYAAANLYNEFAFFGLHPLNFLARVISITESGRDHGSTLMLGTPLFVEFARKD